jgi:hypothetical protein
MELSKTEKLEALERLLQSRVLHGSESLKSFLRFVVLKTIEHQDGHLKEYTIATEVFGRSLDYDTRNDSVVRVQAGRLRTKLHEYYATEGKEDPILIDLPKGQYTPVFSYAEPANGSLTPQAAVAPTQASALEESVRAEPAAVDARWWKAGVAILAALSILLGGLLFSYEARRGEAGPAGVDLSADVKSALPVWGGLLNSREPVLVTFSNTLFDGTAETGMKLLKPLDSPGTTFTSSAATRPAQASAVTDHYTGIGEVMGVYWLADLFSKARQPFRVKRSLLMTWDDLKAENIVVLGSPAENILLRDLPQKQEFVFRLLRDDNQKPTFGIENTKPKGGEQVNYFAKQEGPSRSQISEDYAVISLLRGLDAEHRLLILAGITTFGTQAAAEYVTRPEYIRELVSRLNVASAGEQPRLPEYYQVLIKVKVNGGVPVQISYVTHHVLE